MSENSIGDPKDVAGPALRTPGHGRFGGGDMQEHLARMGRQLEEMEAQHQQMFGGRQPDRGNLAKATARYWQGITDASAMRHVSAIEMASSQDERSALALLHRSPSSPTPGNCTGSDHGSPSAHSRNSQHMLQTRRTSLPRASTATPVSRGARSMTADQVVSASMEIRGSHSTSFRGAGRRLAHANSGSASPVSTPRSGRGGAPGHLQGVSASSTPRSQRVHSAASTPRSHRAASATSTPRSQRLRSGTGSETSSPTASRDAIQQAPAGADRAARVAALQAYWERMVARHPQPGHVQAASPGREGDTHSQLPVPGITAASGTSQSAASPAHVIATGGQRAGTEPLRAADVQVYKYPRGARAGAIDGSDSDDGTDSSPQPDARLTTSVSAPAASASSCGASSEGSVPPSLLMMPEPSFSNAHYSSAGSSRAGSPTLPPPSLPLAHNITFDPSPGKNKHSAVSPGRMTHVINAHGGMGQSPQGGAPSTHGHMAATAHASSEDFDVEMLSSPPPRQPSNGFLEADSVLMGSPLPHNLQQPATATQHLGPGGLPIPARPEAQQTRLGNASAGPLVSRFTLPKSFAAEPRVLLYEPGRYAGSPDTSEPAFLAQMHQQEHVQQQAQLMLTSAAQAPWPRDMATQPAASQQQHWPVLGMAPAGSWSPAGPGKPAPSRWSAGDARVSAGRGTAASVDPWQGGASSALPFSPERTSPHPWASPSSMLATPGHGNTTLLNTPQPSASPLAPRPTGTPYAAGSDTSFPATPATAPWPLAPHMPAPAATDVDAWHAAHANAAMLGSHVASGSAAPGAHDAVFMADLTATQNELRAAIVAAQAERQALDASLTQLTSAAALLQARGSALGMPGTQAATATSNQQRNRSVDLPQQGNDGASTSITSQQSHTDASRKLEATSHELPPDLGSPVSTGKLAALKQRRHQQRAHSPSPSAGQQEQQQQEHAAASVSSANPQYNAGTPSSSGGQHTPVPAQRPSNSASNPGSASSVHMPGSGTTGIGQALHTPGSGTPGSAYSAQTPGSVTSGSTNTVQARGSTRHGSAQPTASGTSARSVHSRSDVTAATPQSRASTGGTAQTRRSSSTGRAYAGPGGGGGVATEARRRSRRASHDVHHSGYSGGFSPLTLELPGAGTPTNSIMAAMQRRRRSMSEIRSSSLFTDPTPAEPLLPPNATLSGVKQQQPQAEPAVQQQLGVVGVAQSEGASGAGQRGDGGGLTLKPEGQLGVPQVVPEGVQQQQDSQVLQQQQQQGQGMAAGQAVQQLGQQGGLDVVHQLQQSWLAGQATTAGGQQHAQQADTAILPHQHQQQGGQSLVQPQQGGLAVLQAWDAYRTHLSGQQPPASRLTTATAAPMVLRLPGGGMELGHGATGLSSTFSPGHLAAMNSNLMQPVPTVGAAHAATDVLPQAIAVQPAAQVAGAPLLPALQQPALTVQTAVNTGQPVQGMYVGAGVSPQATPQAGRQAVGSGARTGTDGGLGPHSHPLSRPPTTLLAPSPARKTSADNVPIISSAWPAHDSQPPSTTATTAQHTSSAIRPSITRAQAHHQPMHTEAHPQQPPSHSSSQTSSYPTTGVGPQQHEEPVGGLVSSSVPSALWESGQAGQPSALQRLKLKCLQRHALSGPPQVVAPDASPSRALDQGVGLRRPPQTAVTPAPASQRAAGQQRAPARAPATPMLAHGLRTPTAAAAGSRGMRGDVSLSGQGQAAAGGEARDDNMEAVGASQDGQVGPKPYLKRKSQKIVATKVDWSHVKPRTVSRMADYDCPPAPVRATHGKSPLNSPSKHTLTKRANPKPTPTNKATSRLPPAPSYLEHDNWSPAKPGTLRQHDNWSPAKPNLVRHPVAATRGAQHHQYGAAKGYELTPSTGAGQYASPNQYRQAAAGRVVDGGNVASSRSPGSPLDDLLLHVNHLLRDFDKKFNVQ